jgi:hypothetical protein
MGLLKYSEHDLRGLLSRVIHVRWPAEKLLLLTPCRKDSAEPGRLPSELHRAELGIDRGEVEPGSERGFLAATQSRLIFHEEVTSGLLVRAISIIIGVLAVAVLFFGDGLASFLPMGAMALALWGIAKVLEVLLAGRAEIAFTQVANLDPASQRIEGMARNGTLYRLGVPDPSDFLLVSALVQGRGATAA